MVCCSVAGFLTEPQDHDIRRGEGPGRDQRAHAAQEGRAALARRGNATGPQSHPIQCTLVSYT